MGRKVIFTVHGAPKGKARPRVVDGHAFTPRKTVAYESQVVLAFRQANPGWERWGKGIPLRMSISAFYKIPASASQRAQNRMKSGEIKPTKKPDTDNIGKIIADACNGIVYYDDAQIVDMHVVKSYAPFDGVYVEIEEIEYHNN